MSDSKKKDSAPQAPSVVIPLVSLKCPAEGCNKKHTRAGFCAEHFEWFKEGLINRDGERPKDFDKKHQAFLRRNAA